MKQISLFIILLFFFSSCFNSPNKSKPISKLLRKRVAVLPFQIHTAIGELPKGVKIEMINKKEQEKSTIVQLHLYRYMLREYAKSSRKVKLQHFNDTNKILKDRGLEYDDIFNLPKNKLARILKVDALVYGNLYQSKKRLQLDGQEDFKNKVNNSIATVVYVYGRNKKDKLLWKDERLGSGFPSDYAPEVVKNLLRKTAKEFPFE